MQMLVNNVTSFFLYSKDFNNRNLVSSDFFDFEAYLKLFSGDELLFMKEFTTKTMVI